METLRNLEEQQLLFLAGALGMALTAVTVVSCMIAVQWRKLRLRELELAFKDDLLDQGLTAAEIDLLWTGSRPGLIEQCSSLLASCWHNSLRCLSACLVGCRQFVRKFSRCVVGVCLSCAKFARKAVRTLFQDRERRTQQSLEFKRELLDRGLSVEQIERLLNAGHTSLLARLIRVSYRVSCALLLAVMDCCRVMWSALVSLYHRLVASRNRGDDWHWNRV